MGKIKDSAGSFLGLSDGPQAPQGQFNNSALSQLNNQNGIFYDPTTMNMINQAAQSGDVQGQINKINSSSVPTYQQQGLMNALATGSTTGSQYATQQVQNNPILGQLYGQNGLLSNDIGLQKGQQDILGGLQNQGFQLKPEDQTLYGQEAGNIARQFGQQGNQAANSLASRGLSSSGAAGATFSGLAGNQNEQLAQAQQQIAQQRFQNTMSQIGQQQQFISQLNNTNASLGQGANAAIQDQYGRQLAGAQNQTQGLTNAAGLQSGQNNAQNQYGMGAAQFNVANTPKNFMDFTTAGLGQGLQSIAGGGLAGATGSSSINSPGGGAGGAAPQGGKSQAMSMFAG